LINVLIMCDKNSLLQKKKKIEISFNINLRNNISSLKIN